MASASDFAMGIAGPALSFVGGAWTQAEANERAREARDKLKKQAEKVGKEYGEVEGRYEPYTGDEGLGADYAAFQAANKAFKQKSKGYDETEEWQYDLPQGVRDVWDPFFNEKVNLATANVYGGAANAGKLMSSATARNTAQAVSKQYDQSYDEALNAALEQERQSYQHYAEQVARERALADQYNQRLQQTAENYREAAGMGFSNLQNLSQIGMNRISDVANLNVASINAGAQQNSPWAAGFSQVGQSLNGFGNSYWGGKTSGSNAPSAPTTPTGGS
jgi:hypothetical protein